MLVVSRNQPSGKFNEKDNSSPDALEDKFVLNFEELVAIISQSNEGSKVVPALCFQFKLICPKYAELDEP